MTGWRTNCRQLLLLAVVSMTGGCLAPTDNQPLSTANPGYQINSAGYQQYQCGSGVVSTTGKFEPVTPYSRFFDTRVPAQYGPQSLTLSLAASNFVLKGNSCPMDLFIIEGKGNSLIEPSGVTEIRQSRRGKPSLLCFYRIPRSILGNDDYRIRFYPDRLACSLPTLSISAAL